MEQPIVPDFLTQSIHVPITDKRVGFAKRFGVVIIDWILISIVSFIIAALFTDTFAPMVVENELRSAAAMREWMPGIPATAVSTEGVMFLWKITSFISGFLGIVVSLMEVTHAASPAKMLLGLRIAQADGVEASQSVLATRWSLKHLSAILFLTYQFYFNLILMAFAVIIFLVYLVGCCMALGQRRQALHDILAKTAVYHVDDLQVFASREQVVA